MKNYASYLLFFLFSLTLLPRVHCADGTFSPSFYTQEIYKELQNLATLLNRDIKSSLGFCIKDVKKDWVEAFDFTGKLDFVDSCVKTKGDFRDRICTAAEIRYYFQGFLEQGGASSAIYVKPNRNCNLTSRVSGCEPGWGCSAVKKDMTDIPYRTGNCQPCCEGFFCPQGLTCMIHVCSLIAASGYTVSGFESRNLPLRRCSQQPNNHLRMYVHRWVYLQGHSDA